MENAEETARLKIKAMADFQRLTRDLHAGCYLQRYCSALDAVLPSSAWAFYYCDGSIEVFVIGDRSIEDPTELVELASKLLDDEASLLDVSEADMIR